MFRSRSARKIYWAITVGVPMPHQGKASCFLVKQATRDGEQMVVAEHGDDGAQHSMTYFSVDRPRRRPLRLGHAQAGDRPHPSVARAHESARHADHRRSALFHHRDFEKPEQLGEGLHLHARRLSLPLRGGKRLDVSAPLPPHMRQSFDALGFDANRYDVQNTDPEED